MSEDHVSRRRASHRKDRGQVRFKVAVVSNGIPLKLTQSRSFTPPAYLVRTSSSDELVGASYEVDYC
jgi:hypothetical protein